jgi:hypothetical protein
MATEYSFIGKTGDQTEYAAVIRQNEQSVVSSLQIDATNNAMSAGPITMAYWCYCNCCFWRNLDGGLDEYN